MNSDIRIATSFRGHRKRKKLKMLLGLTSGPLDYLIDLWIATAENHPDGVLLNMSEIDIALEANWEGDPHEFVKALEDAGFLDQTNGTYTLHDWADHQPWVCHSKQRSERAKQAARIRWGKENNANGMQPACESHTKCNAPSPSPYPSPFPNPSPKHNADPDESASSVRLAKLLLDLILNRRDSFKKPNLKTWAKYIDLMIRKDGRDPKEIERVIIWCQQDPFWQNNILSTLKLRNQYDQLALKKQSSINQSPPYYEDLHENPNV